MSPDEQGIEFERMIQPLLERVDLEYSAQGRGMLQVGFYPNQENAAGGRYVTLNEVREAGFSADIVRAIEGYDPQCEAILFVNFGQSARLVRVTVERHNSSSEVN